MSTRRLLAIFPPEQLVLLSIVGTICVGTILLALPSAQIKPAPLLDLFFTATSATCVTGLFTIPIDQFSLFGKAVLLLLIQIGGLGIITMTLLFLSTFMNLGLGTQLMAGRILELESWKQIRRTLFVIISVTFLTELLGTVCIFGVLKKSYSFGMALFIATFHSVSSFCSAGITLLEGGMSAYSNNIIMVLITIILMFVGELGFVTWQEISDWFIAKLQHKTYRFSLHSKIVLYASTILLSCSGIIFWILEHNNILANLSAMQTTINTLFYVISFRSTGFLLTSIGSFHLATILLIMIIAFIGSAPGSTGSGIKVTTFAIFLATVKAAISGKTSVTIKGRTIPMSQVFRAIAILIFGLGWILLTTFCLLITEKGFSFIEILFESTSAFTSLGMSTGITSKLSTIGKLFLITSMIVGRIGSFTLILALKLRKKQEVEYTYPEERVMLS
jgi:trk system potassium uptake protein TrkH